MAVPTAQSRDASELYQHLLDLAPPFVAEPEEILRAILKLLASQAERVEAAIATARLRTYLTTADGAYLDVHGAERGVYRFSEESDADYRVRVQAIEEQVTKAAIVDAVNQILEIGTCELEENVDGAWAGHPGFPGFADNAVCHDSLRGFTVYIPQQLITRHDRGYALEPGKTGQNLDGFELSYTTTSAKPAFGAFAEAVEPVANEVYRRVLEAVDRLRAAGVPARIEIV